MRLIDADKLIMHLSDYALQEAPMLDGDDSAYQAIVNCIGAVENAETVEGYKANGQCLWLHSGQQPGSE